MNGYMNMGVWLWTLGVLGVVLIFDFTMAYRNRNKVTSLRAATAWTIFYISLAIGFGISLGIWADHQARNEFFAGWLTEYSLSFDNLFIFILILARLKVEKEREEIVLFGGILFSLILRGVFIAAGALIIHHFSPIFFLFGGFLIYTSIQLFRETEEQDWKEGKVITYFRKKGASTAVIAFIALATTDILFALDSIPAIFGLTTNPYIVVTANIFALMGLRQLYFLIGGMMKKLIFLTEGLSAILAFIGVKLLLQAMHDQGWEHVAGITVPKISLGISLGFIATTLTITTAVSLWSTRGSK